MTMRANKMAGIMSSIYNETPEYWPYGISVDAYKEMDGNVYFVRDKKANAVGFVGWQERKEDNKTVGYYSIGILPEHRNKGYAKQAVEQVVAIKSAGVDEVRACIVKGNTPSVGLAKKLNISIKEATETYNYMNTKQANGFLRKLNNPIAKGLIGGTLGGAFAEAENRSYMQDMDHATKGISRLTGILTGIVAGAGGRKARTAALSYYPMKVIGTYAAGRGGQLTDTANTFINTQKSLTDTNLAAASKRLEAAAIEAETAKDKSGMQPSDVALLGLAGAGAIGSATYLADRLGVFKKKRTKRKDGQKVLKGDPSQRRRGKMKIELPTSSLPKEFFDSLVDADDRMKALTTVKQVS